MRTSLRNSGMAVRQEECDSLIMTGADRRKPRVDQVTGQVINKDIFISSALAHYDLALPASVYPVFLPEHPQGGNVRELTITVRAAQAQSSYMKEPSLPTKYLTSPDSGQITPL